MTMYRSWIQAFCLLALAAMLPFQEGVEFLFCLIMAGLITWKVSAFAGTPPVRMPMTSAPANDTFTRLFPLTVSAACTSQYAAILSPGDDYEQPVPDSLSPCWKYEPDTLAARLVPEPGGCGVYVQECRIGDVPAELFSLACSWLEDNRIISSSVSFYGGPYRKYQGDAVVDCHSPWDVQMNLTIRKKNHTV